MLVFRKIVRTFLIDGPLGLLIYLRDDPIDELDT